NNSINIINNFDLVKWSIFFIAQSLVPLKRKNNLHSLIFIKLLEARGFLDLFNKNNGSVVGTGSNLINTQSLPSTLQMNNNKLGKPIKYDFNNIPVISQNIKREELTLLNNQFYNYNNNVNNSNNIIKQINNKFSSHNIENNLNLIPNNNLVNILPNMIINNNINSDYNNNLSSRTNSISETNLESFSLSEDGSLNTIDIDNVTRALKFNKK